MVVYDNEKWSLEIVLPIVAIYSGLAISMVLMGQEQFGLAFLVLIVSFLVAFIVPWFVKMSLQQKLINMTIYSIELIYDRRRDPVYPTVYVTNKSVLLSPLYLNEEQINIKRTKLITKDTEIVDDPKSKVETLNIEILYEYLPREVKDSITKEELVNLVNDIDIEDGKEAYYVILEDPFILDINVNEGYDIDIIVPKNYTTKYVTNFRHMILILPMDIEKIRPVIDNVFYKGFFINAKKYPISGFLKEVINGLPIIEITHTLNHLYNKKLADENIKNFGVSVMDKVKNKIISTLIAFKYIYLTSMSESKTLTAMHREGHERSIQMVKKLKYKMEDKVDLPQQDNRIVFVVVIAIIILIFLAILLLINGGSPPIAAAPTV